MKHKSKIGKKRILMAVTMEHSPPLHLSANRSNAESSSPVKLGCVVNLPIGLSGGVGAQAWAAAPGPALLGGVSIYMYVTIHMTAHSNTYRQLHNVDTTLARVKTLPQLQIQ